MDHKLSFALNCNAQSICTLNSNSSNQVFGYINPILFRSGSIFSMQGFCIMTLLPVLYIPTIEREEEKIWWPYTVQSIFFLYLKVKGFAIYLPQFMIWYLIFFFHFRDVSKLNFSYLVPKYIDVSTSNVMNSSATATMLRISPCMGFPIKMLTDDAFMLSRCLYVEWLTSTSNLDLTTSRGPSHSCCLIVPVFIWLNKFILWVLLISLKGSVNPKQSNRSHMLLKRNWLCCAAKKIQAYMAACSWVHPRINLN